MLDFHTSYKKKVFCFLYCLTLSVPPPHEISSVNIKSFIEKLLVLPKF